MPSDSFGAASFDVLSAPLQRGQEGLVSVRKIPGGDTTYIDLGGRQPLRLTADLFVPTDAALATLESLVATQATLSYTEGTFSAVLLRVQRQRREHDGANWTHTVTAEFLLL